MRKTIVLAGIAVLPVLACASAGGGTDPGSAANEGSAADSAAERADVSAVTEAAERTAERAAEGDLVPAGYGTLRQEQITISLQSDALLVKLTPLDEAIIRLTAPDTYRRLHALAQNRIAELVRGSGVPDPEPFLVSFFSYQPDVEFEPNDVQLMHQGRLLRPLAVVPVTPGWGRQRLRQQERQMAIYGFAPGIDYYDSPLVVRYGLEESDRWNRVVQTLEVERSRVLSQTS